MELRHLSTFVAVAEEGSFTRAADRLNVVQSAVSAGVRALERELGATLFDRSTHRVQLSDTGTVLLPEARATLAAARAARDAVDQSLGGLRGTVTLGILQSSPMRIGPLLAAFRATHPAVELHARQALAGVTLTRIREGRLDLAVVAAPAARSPGITLSPLMTLPLSVAVPSDHRFAGRAAVTLAEVAGEEFVDGPEGFGLRTVIDRAFTAAGLARRITLEVNDMATLIDFVRCGLAIAFLTPAFTQDMSDLALVPIRGQAPTLDIYLAQPADRRPTAAAAALAALVLNARPSAVG